MAINQLKENTVSHHNRLALSLLIMRLSIFLVLLMWTLDKFLRPEHASGVFKQFYGLSGFTSAWMTVLAIMELLIILLFVLGLFKGLTYLAVLMFHTISVLSSYQAYFTPFNGPHLLFFAAIPMWAACLSLYLMRDSDKWFNLSKKKEAHNNLN
jgi:putative oxidoreductase